MTLRMCILSCMISLQVINKKFEQLIYTEGFFWIHVGSSLFKNNCGVTLI